MPEGVRLLQDDEVFGSAQPNVRFLSDADVFGRGTPPIPQPSPQPPPVPRPAPGTQDFSVTNVGLGVVERVKEIGKGLLSFTDNLARELESAVPLSFDKPLAVWNIGGTDIKIGTAPGPGEQSAPGAAAEAVEGIDTGFQPEGQVQWDQVKADPHQFPRYLAEQGFRMLPDMVLATLPPTVVPYIMGRSGEIAEARAKNDGRERPNADDLAIATGAATMVALMERTGARAVFGLDKSNARSNAIAEVLRRAGKEGATEAPQEVLEALAETAGTKRGIPSGEELLVDSALPGFLLGAGVGGTVGAGAVTAERLTGQTQDDAEGSPPTPTPETDPAAPASPEPSPPPVPPRGLETSAAGPAPPPQAAEPERPTVPAPPPTPQQTEAIGAHPPPPQPETPPGQRPPPEVRAPADRSIDEIAAERDTAEGSRQRMDWNAIEGLQKGDKLWMIPPGGVGQPVTVERASPSVLRVVGADDQVAAVVTRGPAKPSDPAFYTARGAEREPTETEKAAADQAKREAEEERKRQVKAQDETKKREEALTDYSFLTNAVTERLERSPRDMDDGAALQKLRTDTQFYRLDEQLRGRAEKALHAHQRFAAAEAAKDAAPAPVEPTPAPAPVEEVKADARPAQEPEDVQESPQETQPQEPEAEERRDRPQSEAEGERDVITPAGRRVRVRPEVVEAGTLIASHSPEGTVNPTFPAELQPRDRSRVASQTQIAKMASELTPELLMPTAQSSEGAPIIGGDGVVESGNARTLAILEAYRRRPDRARDYREALAAAGYNVEGMEQPVLVQRRVGDMTPEERQAFTREANQRTTAERGASEIASADAAAINDAVIANYRFGAIKTAENRNFVRAFVDTVIPETERAAMMTSEGALSQAGVTRIENALFSKAYGDPELLASLREDLTNPVKGIGQAMIEAAPLWSQMRAVAPHMDTTDSLIEAVRLVDRARSGKETLDQLVNQRDIFTGEAVDPQVEAYLRLMFRNTDKWTQQHSQQKIAFALSEYARLAQEVSPEADMLGGARSSADVLAETFAILNRDETRAERQKELLAAAQAEAAPDVNLFAPPQEPAEAPPAADVTSEPGTAITVNTTGLPRLPTRIGNPHTWQAEHITDNANGLLRDGDRVLMQRTGEQVEGVVVSAQTTENKRAGTLEQSLTVRAAEDIHPASEIEGEGRVGVEEAAELALDQLDDPHRAFQTALDGARIYQNTHWDRVFEDPAEAVADEEVEDGIGDAVEAATGLAEAFEGVAKNLAGMEASLAFRYAEKHYKAAESDARTMAKNRAAIEDETAADMETRAADLKKKAAAMHKAARRTADEGAKRSRLRKRAGMVAGNRRLVARIEVDATRMLPSNVDVDLVQRINDDSIGMYRIDPNTARPLIEVALSEDPLGVFHHEVVHALRDTGAITNRDFAALIRASAANDWTQRYEVAERYPEFEPWSADAQEEAIADAFQDWMMGREAPSTRIQRIFQRMAEFIGRIVRALNIEGIFPSLAAESIFSDIASGRAKAKAILDAGGAPRAARRRTAPVLEAAQKAGLANAEEVASEMQAATVGRTDADVAKTSAWLDKVRSTAHGWLRKWEHLPETERTAPLLERLRYLASSQDVALQQTNTFMRRMIHGLDPEQIDTMSYTLALRDLLWTGKEGMTLPFKLPDGSDGKLTEARIDQIAEMVTHLDARVAEDPVLAERMEMHRAMLAEMREALVASGVLDEKRVRNTDYWMHDVLAFNKMVEAATGTKVVRPRQAGRKGSEKAINLHYEQVWTNYLIRAHMDIQTADFINWLRKSDFNMAGSLRERARETNANNLRAALEEEVGGTEAWAALDRKMRDTIAGSETTADFAQGARQAFGDWAAAPPKLRAFLDFRQRIAIGNGNIRDAARGLKQDDIATVPEQHKAALHAVVNGEPSNVTKHFQFLTWLMQEAGPEFQGMTNGAARVLRATADRRRWEKTTLGRDWIDPMDGAAQAKAFYPEGDMVAWQPDSVDGKTQAVNMYAAKALPDRIWERMAQKVVEGMEARPDAPNTAALETFAEVFDMLKRTQTVTAIGGPKEQMVLPREVAETLNNFRDPAIEGAAKQVFSKATTYWKIWQLFNPIHLSTYLTNNFGGDYGAIGMSGYGWQIMGGGNPARHASDVKHAWSQAAKLRRGEEVDGDTQEAVHRGVMWGSITQQEFQESGLVENTAGRVSRWIQPAATWFDKSRAVALDRDNAYRLLAYRHMREIVNDKGFDPTTTGYAMTPPSVVKGLMNDREALAARMAIDIMGDYFVSKNGRWFRRYVAPFWSWCVPTDTEILTRDGWKRHDEIEVGDPVLTWNVERDETEWQPIKKLAVFDHDGPLDVIEGKYGRFRWTPDHRVPVIKNAQTVKRPYGSYHYPAKRSIVRSHELNHHHRIPLVAPHKPSGKSILSVDEAAMLGWLVTDGYIRQRTKGGFEAMIYQSPKKHAAAIRERFATSFSSESVHPDTGVIAFRLAARSPAILNIRRVFKSKDDMPRIVTRLSGEAAAAMFEAMRLAEGTASESKHQEAWVQTPGPVMEAFQILAYLNGVATKKVSMRGGEIERVYLKRHRTIQPARNDRYQEHYSGEVWCPVTDNGTWVMRQGGSVMVTGNTESNTRRVLQALSNIPRAGREAGIKRGVAMGAYVTGRLLVWATIGQVGMYLWNNLLAGDEEEVLPQFQQSRNHITMPFNLPGGRTLVFNMEGALPDALSFLGYRRLKESAWDLMHGRADVVDVAGVAAMGPVQLMADSLNPIWKTPIELAMGVQSWPALAQARTIQDRGAHLARTVGLEGALTAVEWAMGAPISFTPTAEAPSKILPVRILDPDEQAYLRLRGLAMNWKRHVKGWRGPGYRRSESGKMLYYWRRAKRNGDKETAKEALNEWRRVNMEAGATSGQLRRRMATSLRHFRPLGMLSKKEQGEFLQTLSKGERRLLTRAERFFGKTYRGG